MSEAIATYQNLFDQVEASGRNFMESYRTTSKEPLPIEKNLIICGMGGSGISGDYIKQIADEQGKVNVIVNKNYELPSFINRDWEAVITSYSGNTEETLNSFYQLIDRGIKPVCITSGGKLMQKAMDTGLQFIKIPTGIQPRAAFPFLFGSILGLVGKAIGFEHPDIEEENRIIEGSALSSMDSLTELIEVLQTKFPIILHPNALSCVAKRFRCQLNENSKIPASTYEVPEFSHNAIVGLDGKRGAEQCLILLRSNEEYTRTSIHLDFLRDQMNEQAGYIHEFSVKTQSRLEEMLRFTWVLDWISIELARKQNIDPAAVPSIDRLKSVLKSA